MIQITEKLLQEIYKEAKKCYPHEACGFLIGQLEGDQRIAEEFVATQNIQNELHEKDPKRYPRDAKTAYTIDPKEMQSVQKKVDESRKSLISIFHSHPEHGVYFSDEDKGMAAPWGEPLFPELSYIVVSVYDGHVKNASEFYWDKDQKDFLENKIL